jgi:hypothetical protein
MPPAVSALVHRLGAAHAVGWRDALRIALIASLHVASLAIMAFTEADIVAKLAFLLAWGILNFFWLVLTRRPLVSAALSLMMIVALVLVSRLKFDIIWMTANFLDVLVIDSDTVSFLVGIIPGLYRNIIVSVVVVLPLVALLWRFDTFRMRMRTSAFGLGACLAGIAAVSFAQPQEDWETFLGGSYVSKFARSGATAISELMLHGYMESDAVVTDRLKLLPDATCVPAQKPPHIIMVHDESSFDIRSAPGIKVPEGYGSHFLSFDGKARHFIVEGAGGPSWYTEYNVLAGLSARSFGKFSYYVTRIAAGRVERGLPTALRRCGYHTFSIYPALGAFMSARSFQTGAGVQNFLDQKSLGTSRVEPDQFYYDAARRTIEHERGKGPMFLYVYLAQNHYPWNYRWRPDQPARLRRHARSPQAGFPHRILPARPLRRPPARFRLLHPGAEPGRSRHSAAPDQFRSALFHHLLRHRCRQLSAREYVLCDRNHRRSLSADDHPGVGRPAARCLVRRAEKDFRALQGRILCLRGRRRSPALQSVVDRCRPDQRAVSSLAHAGGSAQFR